VPERLGRYQLVSRIGRGGMAQVFHARQQGIGGFERDVAVKVLLPEYASEGDFVDMLLDEARIAGAIGHPNVVGVIDVGQENELFYLVMEYVDGTDLRSVLRSAQTGRLPLNAALYITGEVLRGLGAVHRAVDREGAPRRIIHRDVSPANVLLDRSGVVKLGDFGIAHASSRITRTRPGAVKGKLRYMAPEQLTGKPVDHRADLYAVGIVLCEMLIGIDSCEPKRMTPFGPVFAWSRQLAPKYDLPADIADLLDRAVAEGVEARFADAGAFRAGVSKALHRRHPGYGAEDLHRDLMRLGALVPGRRAGNEPTEVSIATHETPPPSGPHDLLDLSDAQSLFSEEQKPTAPFRPVSRALFDDEPLPPTVPSPRITEPSPIVRVPMPWKKIGVVGACAAAGLLSITVAIVLGSSSSAAPLPVASAQAPVVQPLAPPRPTTGKLSVEGPAGATIMIGSTAYPPAPCQLELPPGHYAVKLRRHSRARAVVREVTIEPGREIALRL
jgi:serine/threonine-protein kinase